MNLLFLCLFPPALDGSGYSNRELILRLLPRGYDIQVIAQPCPGDQTYDQAFFAEHGVQIWRVPCELAYEDTPPSEDQQASVNKYIQHHLTQQRPDLVVIGHDSWCWYGPTVQRFSIPTVQFVRGTPTRAITQGIYPPAATESFIKHLLSANHIVSVAEHFKTLLLGLGASPPNISVLYTPFEASSMVQTQDNSQPARLKQQLGIPPTHKIVLHASNHYPVKRIMDFFASAKIVQQHRQDVHYILLGEGPDTPKLMASLASYPLRSRFHLLGRLPRQLVLDYMRASDLFVLCSESEGLPRVVLEAYATMLPVLVADMPAGREITRVGTIGRLYPVGDVEQLAQKTLTALHQTPEENARQTRLAKTFLAQNMTVRNQLDQLEMIFAELANRTRASKA
ncbi:MAG: glycosyltransferase [Bacteroidota bacterium]